MTQSFPLMVPGARPEGEPVQVTAPYDGAPIASVERGGAQALERALATAHALYRDRDAWLSGEERIRILRGAAERVRERRDELAIGAAREGGKPLIDSRVEVDRAVEGILSCVEHLRTRCGHGIPMDVNAASAGRLAFTQHEPIGVVLAFSAFNHPLNLIVHQVCPALAAGCPFVVKPAEATPLSCLRLVRILHEAGLPPEWGQALVGLSHELSAAAVADRRVGFFSFIGSGEVGWMLRSKLAPGARCALEHGGVAPVVLAGDADLEQAVPLLAKGGFYHAGQVCVSVQRVFAHRSIARAVARGLADAGSKLVVGDPTRPDTEVGPLIRPAEVDRVGEWVDEAVGAGAELLCGGKALSETCYAPTVLLDPPDDARVSTHEVFGPVVCVYGYDEVDAAIARANALPYSFQAAVFTRSLDTALRVTRRIDAATVMVNDHTAFRVDWMPFAGLRESGHGIGGIPYTMEDMQVEKMIVIRSAEL